MTRHSNSYLSGVNSSHFLPLPQQLPSVATPSELTPALQLAIALSKSASENPPDSSAETSNHEHESLVRDLFGLLTG